MPTRTLYCRWPKCQQPVDTKPGEIPDVCPKCQQTGMWTVLPPSSQTTEDVRMTLSVNDKRFLRSLRSLRIAPPEDEPDDGA